MIDFSTNFRLIRHLLDCLAIFDKKKAESPIFTLIVIMPDCDCAGPRDPLRPALPPGGV